MLLQVKKKKKVKWSHFFKVCVCSFLTVLGLRCSAWAFSSRGEQGLGYIALHGPLIVMASPVADNRL